MALFDVFKKKACCICGNEVGLIGNRKLEDGNMCNKCAKLLSPWFEERRHSTVDQIRQQLAYREANRQALEQFTVTRTIGEAYKMYIEEVNGVPTRFFVTDATDYKQANPDIISFQDVISCVTDIEVRQEEMKQRDNEGKMVSYNPPRYKVHHNFYIKMQIRNNPYFDDIRFYVNRGVVTLESVGGFGAGVASAFMRGAGVSNARISTGSFRDMNEQRRYNEYQQMCQIIEQAVEDGKRGSQPAQSFGADPVLGLIQQIRSAPDIQTATQLMQSVAMLSMNRSDKDAIIAAAGQALGDAQNRFLRESVGAAPAMPAQPSPAPEAAGPKFCPNCGAQNSGGKFCEFCGTRLQ